MAVSLWFTADALAFTEGRYVKFIDGPRLVGLIQQAQESLGSGSRTILKIYAAAEAMEPQRPICASAVVRSDGQERCKCPCAVLGLLTLPFLPGYPSNSLIMAA